MTPFIDRLTEKYPDLTVCIPAIQNAFDLLQLSFQQGNKLLLCGNGGSAADCEHLVGELMKGYLLPRSLPPTIRQKLIERFPDNGTYLADHLQGALPALSLVSQTALLTAYGNDVSSDMAFAQQVYGYGRPGDVLLGISTSGNARNVVYALQVGRAMGLHTIGCTGRSGGALLGHCDVAIRVPWDQTADIQERHLAIYHALCGMLEEAFFTEST
jgi:phosphoheptose isomerase